MRFKTVKQFYNWNSQHMMNPPKFDELDTEAKVYWEAEFEKYTVKKGGNGL